MIERRYTHFLNLYNTLRRDYPELMSSIVFPKKVIMGNFDNELISSRSTGFESLLKHICLESRLRSSRSLLDFLRDVEMNKAKEFINQGDHASAYPILENCFKLLNKVINSFMDVRHHYNFLFMVNLTLFFICMTASQLCTVTKAGDHYIADYHSILK